MKKQTRKLAVACSKHCFEVVDEVSSKHGFEKIELKCQLKTPTDEVSSKHCFEVVDELKTLF
ncbi:chlorohydrolase [Streptococcus pneumoniae]|uniref:hypothetical protein n=1 Tax=Streptococcus pneumoniae TaxID=1313 RepID=UPI000B71EE75|nr:hypothetical protein [Streptococcus pneumoniae]SNF35545.1 chlorohydrolase [Streptococcus pneumoniae]